MIKKWFSLFGLLLLFNSFGFAQQNTDVLLSVGDEKVVAEDFWAIYQKNSKIQGKAEKTSLKEYLDLYINFKLKVKEAKDAKMDTAQAFINELEGYRKQLAKPYLVVQELNDETVYQLYQRMQNNVRASHILIRLPENPMPQDTLAAFQMAIQIRDEIQKGKYSFAEAAEIYSEDPSARDTEMENGRPGRLGNKGDLGYFGVFDMVYSFEEAVYSLQIGEISKPVRTRFGYHLIYLSDKIPAIGEVEVAHIFIKKSPSAEIDSAKLKIDAIYKQLQDGKAFDTLAKAYSDDKGSSSKGGLLPKFGANRMVPEFISTLSKMQIGAISKPIKTSFGWHIIQFIDQDPIKDFEQSKAEIKEKLKRDVRSHKGEQAKIAQIKKEENFKEYPENREEANRLITVDFYAKDFRLKGMESHVKPLFSIRQKVYTQYDFLKFFAENKKTQVPSSLQTVIEDSYKAFVDKSCLEFEEQHLQEKYPEYRIILNEYREGILLFDLMDKKVWSKASSDSLGLMQYFNKNRKKYRWEKRAQLVVFKTNDKEKLAKIEQAYQPGKPEVDIINSLKQDSLNPIPIEHLLVESGKTVYDQYKWKKGAVVQLIDENGEQQGLIYFSAILPKTDKELNETRGKVIADYQNYLEKLWLKDLKHRYKVRVNKKVYRKLKAREKL
ncbi:MAG: peptidylprolyl isomerase [Bacteroidales bacterium]|nr:peptidylprolyl isomerase [Bacteroidales bacterium]